MISSCGRRIVLRRAAATHPDWGTQVTVVAHINGWPSCGKFTIGARLAAPIEGRR